MQQCPVESVAHAAPCEIEAVEEALAEDPYGVFVVAKMLLRGLHAAAGEGLAPTVA
jgi:hypothetical protein